jgi:hypothetical protein
MSPPSLHAELRLAAPDDIFEAVRSLGDGLGEDAARAALAAFALVLANEIGDDATVLAAVASVREAFRDFPQASSVGTRPTEARAFEVGGALASLRRVIELKPAPSVPGALTS